MHHGDTEHTEKIFPTNSEASSALSFKTIRTCFPYNYR
jgi:hypothetical protein